MRLLLLLLSACALTPDDPATCARLEVDACAEREGCRTIDGRPLQADSTGALCVDFRMPGEPVGCMAADLGCDDAETFAIEEGSRGLCVWFPSGCIPEGWVVCEWADYGECVE